ncbi:MAG: hypothetical protein DMF39_09050 [Verrucomicrobia bacterium]|nr:MAG: hypothetical protein DMF39_09050 [Verrucomicrobiota bacterium]
MIPPFGSEFFDQNRKFVKGFYDYFLVTCPAMLPYLLFRRKREYQFDRCAVTNQTKMMGKINFLVKTKEASVDRRPRQL